MCSWNGQTFPRILVDCLPTAIVEKKTAAFSCVNARVKGTSLLSIIIESLVFFCMRGFEEDRNCTDCVL